MGIEDKLISVVTTFEGENGENEEEEYPTDGNEEPEPHFVLLDTPAAIHDATKGFSRHRSWESIGDLAKRRWHRLDRPMGT